MIRKAAQAVHAAINASPVTPTVEALECILASTLGAAVSTRVMTRPHVCARGEHGAGPAGVSLDAIGLELDQMASMRAICDAIEKAWFEAGRPETGPLAEANQSAHTCTRATFGRLDALAAAVSRCETASCFGLFLQIAFAEHLYDASTAYEDHVALAKFELARSLQHAALRGLLRLGALRGRRPDLVQPFCPVPEPISAMMTEVEGIDLDTLQ